MQLKFKNAHIFFAVSAIWGRLDYRFKYQLNQLVQAKSDDDFEQAIEVDANTLLFIYQEVSSKPEGVAKTTNQEMLEALQPQVMALAATDPEAYKVLLGIQSINEANRTVLNTTIESGKSQILA